MSEQPQEIPPPADPFEHFNRRRSWNRGPVVVTLIVMAVVVGVFAYLGYRWRDTQPWKIPYEDIKIEWISPTDSYTEEGQRYFAADVQFDIAILDSADFQKFLAALLRRTKGIYEYYHIRGLNKEGVFVLEGYAAKDERFSISATPDYADQGRPKRIRIAPPLPDENAPLDKSP